MKYRAVFSGLIKDRPLQSFSSSPTGLESWADKVLAALGKPGDTVTVYVQTETLITTFTKLQDGKTVKTVKPPPQGL